MNEAVEIAHREGVLTSASLMVAGEAAADAVARARRLPGLQVGLHLVLVEGSSVLGHASLPDLVDEAGWFGSDQVSRGFRYFFSPACRRQLAAEIAAQFASFAATGLALSHVDAHKHMHLHPVVGGLAIAGAARAGAARIRVPAEPQDVLAACGAPPAPGARALFAWSRWLRRAALRAGLAVDDQVFGLRWSGHMDTRAWQRLLPHIPEGRSEIYTHPATHQDATLRRLMPNYDPVGEFMALCDARIGARLREMTGA